MSQESTEIWTAQTLLQPGRFLPPTVLEPGRPESNERDTVVLTRIFLIIYGEQPRAVQRKCVEKLAKAATMQPPLFLLPTRPGHADLLEQIVNSIMYRVIFVVAAVAMVSATGVAWAADYGAPPAVTQGSTHFAWANVLRVDPVYRTVSVRTPRQECYDEHVIERRGGNTTAGTILGAVIGGALGNQVGKGDGRKAATVAGAVAGGAVGHATVEHNAQSYPSTRQHCRDVADVRQERRIQGYDVEYRYRGEVYTSQLDYDPGERLRVRVSVSPVN